MFLSKNAIPLLTIFGGLLKTGAQVQTGRREAELFEFNAAVQRQQATLIQEKAKLDIEKQRRQARQFAAEQKATIGASGVRFSGSPLAVVEDTAAQFILDERIIDFNARVDVFSKLAGAEQSLRQAQIARNSSFIKAGASLLDVLPAFGKLKFTGSSGGSSGSRPITPSPTPATGPTAFA
ncbi:MAG: virion core protein, T7 gp14 family [Candidatus Kariarchaeaceae archaeon]|jgi:hypothetical protein